MRFTAILTKGLFDSRILFQLHIFLVFYLFYIVFFYCVWNLDGALSQFFVRGKDGLNIIKYFLIQIQPMGNEEKLDSNLSDFNQSQKLWMVKLNFFLFFLFFLVFLRGEYKSMGEKFSPHLLIQFRSTVLFFFILSWKIFKHSC